jgi:hypothetical protein
MEAYYPVARLSARTFDTFAAVKRSFNAGRTHDATLLDDLDEIPDEIDIPLRRFLSQLKNQTADSAGKVVKLPGRQSGVSR